MEAHVLEQKNVKIQRSRILKPRLQVERDETHQNRKSSRNIIDIIKVQVVTVFSVNTVSLSHILKPL